MRDVTGECLPKCVLVDVVDAELLAHLPNNGSDGGVVVLYAIAIRKDARNVTEAGNMEGLTSVL